MVFSLFRKKTVVELAQNAAQKPQRPAVPAEPEKPTATPAEAAEHPEELDDLDFEFGPNPEFQAETIDVVETGDSLDPVQEQVAMLYASAQFEDGIVFLESTLAGDSPIESWLMLFDLYYLAGQRQAYEDRALQFVELFKRSAPDWPQEEVVSEQAAPAQTGNSGYFAVSGQLTGASLALLLDQWRNIEAKGAPVRVEFGRLQGLDSEAAHMLRQWMAGKCKVEREWQNLQALLDKLQGRFEVMRPAVLEQNYWLLALEVLQLQGRQEDFENLAVDYAVTYEVSPPSWDHKHVASTAVEQPETVQAILNTDTDAEVFYFSGDVVDGQDSQFAALRQYASQRQLVTLDMHKVRRMDFSSAGWLLNVLLAFQQEGKSSVIQGASAPLCALLRVLGVNEMARMIRRK